MIKFGWYKLLPCTFNGCHTLDHKCCKGCPFSFLRVTRSKCIANSNTSSCSKTKRNLRTEKSIVHSLSLPPSLPLPSLSHLTAKLIIPNCINTVFTASCNSSTAPATIVLISNVHHSKHTINSPGIPSLKKRLHSVRLSQLHPFQVCLCKPLPHTYPMMIQGTVM